jgi:hypothetical protein
MILQRFGSKQVSTSIWILFGFRQGHVALRYSLVPFRSDQAWESSDLSGCGRTGSSSTGSISDSIRSVRSRSDGHWVRERDSHRLARVPMNFPAGVYWRWRSAGFRWSLLDGDARTRYRRSRRARMRGRFPRLLPDEGGGDGWSCGRFGWSPGGLICCVLNQTGGVRRFARRRGEYWEWRERRGSPDGVGIEWKCSQGLRAPASNSGSLAACWARERGLSERGERGAL